MSANNADFDSVPEPFRGTRSHVGPFLAQLDEEFKAQPDVFSSDHAKVSPTPPSFPELLIAMELRDVGAGS